MKILVVISAMSNVANYIMKILLPILLIFISTFCFGQDNLPKKVFINNQFPLVGAFIFFPLTNDSINVENENLFTLISQNLKKRLFYCVYKDEKSKIYNLDVDKLHDSIVNFIIPNRAFFEHLYKLKVCPLCIKADSVIPFHYGKTLMTKSMIRMIENREIKMAGCSFSNTSPKLYCKRDELEF